MKSLIDLCHFLVKSPVLEAQKAFLDQIESNKLFQVAYHKSSITDQKKAYFRSNKPARFIVVTSFNNYEFVSTDIKGRAITLLPHEEFQRLDPADPRQLALLDDAIIIMTNNTLNRVGYQHVANIIAATPHSIYAVHDFDSHHWHDLSLILASLADVYAPGHPGEYLFAGRINPSLICGIPIGSTQWSKEFLINEIPQLDRIERSDQPFGKHSHYPKFRYRNEVVTSLAGFSTDVQLQPTSNTTGFLTKTDRERWLEWAGHKLHFIIPVAHDIPNRFFDALISGGIPMIPLSMKSHIRALGIPQDFYLCYSPTDILNPAELIKRGLEMYDQAGGSFGAIKRALFTFENFHADEIIHKLIEAVQEDFL